MTVIGDPAVTTRTVHECGEPLVDLTGVDARIAIDASRREIASESSLFCFVRQGVAERLVRAARSLPAGYLLVVKEGYRPTTQQERSFKKAVRRCRIMEPDAPEGAVLRSASQYVAPLESAPHPAGAAVDLTLARVAGRGREEPVPSDTAPSYAEVDMGTAFNDEPWETGNRTYWDAPDISETARFHRTVLSRCMLHGGLVNYPYEWWHWSYGDKYWAYVTDGTACYAPLDERSLRRLGSVEKPS